MCSQCMTVQEYVRITSVTLCTTSLTMLCSPCPPWFFAALSVLTACLCGFLCFCGMCCFHKFLCAHTNQASIFDSAAALKIVKYAVVLKFCSGNEQAYLVAQLRCCSCQNLFFRPLFPLSYCQVMVETEEGK